jgi:hypothetical protein
MNNVNESKNKCNSDGKQTIHPIQIEINLQDGEFCYLRSNSDLYEMVESTKSVSFRGPSVKVKLVPGIYYRTGKIKTKKDTKIKLSKIDSGILYITSSRLLFTGSKNNKSIKYKNILDCNVQRNGIEIIKDSGKNAFFTIENDPDFAGRVIKYFLSN